MKKYLGLSIISTAIVAFAFQLPLSSSATERNEVKTTQSLVINSQDAIEVSNNEPGEVIDFQAETD